MAATSFIFFSFSILAFLSISKSTVPPADTFRYVNEGDFGIYESEYTQTYRPLPPFTYPFQLCFYNTTPNSYTLGLRIGTRRDEAVMRWVWEANRGNPVGENATFSFGSDGNLVLAHADGRIAWQTNTANKGVVGFAILDDGNIVLRDSKNNSIWQSFDSPTDTLLIGQYLRIQGPNKLVSRASVTNNVNGEYSFVLDRKRLGLYYKNMLYYSSPSEQKSNLVNATLEIGESEYEENNFYTLRGDNRSPELYLNRIRCNNTLAYLRLGIDGNLRLYSYRRNVRFSSWTLVYTLFSGRFITDRGAEVENECQMPKRCGNFGLCEDSQCVGCPSPNGVFAWSKDCDAKLPVCGAKGGFRYYELKGVDHFMVKYAPGTGPVKQSDCESKCTKDCKCMGYFYHTDRSRCWIAYELKTLTRVGNSTHLAYIKTPIG